MAQSEKPALRWHLMGAGDALSALGSSRDGLPAETARQRLARHGPNELVEKKKRTPLRMFLGQFTDFMILVLIGAAIISGIIGEPSDTIAIAVIVLLNAVIGFVQEYRAERAMAALKKIAAPTATVIRDGMAEGIPSREVVPGDIVLLEAGSVAPADMRLIEAAHLKIDEAALTGESVPSEKRTGPLHDERLPLGDRRNMAYKGTIVTYGRGKGVAAATGMETELGKIAAMLEAVEEARTPLQRKLKRFGQRLALIVMAICAIVFLAGLLRGEPAVKMFLIAISLAVAAIPEALPAVITISLALGARKMVRHNALIRKLPAVEALGSVTFICSDKTGTLTTNRMAVEEIYPGGKGDAGRELLIASALSNDARPDKNGNPIGDPTEVALYLFSRQRGFEKTALDAEFPRMAELPFDSDRKCMTTIHKTPEGFVSYTKGAVEAVIEKSVSMLTAGGEVPLDAGAIVAESERMAEEGLRVLAFAMRRWETIPESIVDAETGLTVIGLAGLMDPVREEVREAISVCKEAGIKPVMITGDHLLTARAVARRLGIVGDDPKAILTGRELEDMPMEEFEERVEHIGVYARVAPDQKLKIVTALKDRGQSVAMTGDGVNDAPALKRADIGVAMGITGTDVAKEAAHMVLLDDNFATIVRAVREGRVIFDNIRKFIKYLLTTNSGEIWTLFLGSASALPIPLLPIHILWINLVTDGLPALALSVEPPEPDVMRRPPRPPGESVFARGLGLHALWVGLLMAGITLGLEAWAVKAENPRWQTMVFTVLCLSQLGHVLAVRSESQSFFTQGVFSNKPLLGAVALTVVLQMAVIYMPALNPVFKTAPLTSGELGLTIALSSIVFFAVEAEKFLKRRASLRTGASGNLS